MLDDALRSQGIAQAVKLYAEKAGYNPADFSGHSLRSGFLTSAADRCASIFKLIEVSRHKSTDTLGATFARSRSSRITQPRGCCSPNQPQPKWLSSARCGGGAYAPWPMRMVILSLCFRL